MYSALSTLGGSLFFDSTGIWTMPLALSCFIYLFIYYLFIFIHMCIQGLGYFSPLPLPPPLPPTKFSSKTKGRLLAASPYKKILKSQVTYIWYTMTQIVHFHSKREE
jgi:hypothetical protein